MSALFGQSSIQSNGSGNHQNLNTREQPPWFQNTKKRTIPNHLVPKKKVGFQISTGTTSKGSKKGMSLPSGSDSSSSFNLWSFGSNQRKSGSQGNILERTNSIGLYDTSSGDIDDTINNALNEEFSLYPNGDDVPPSRSLYDLNDEILVSVNKPTQHADSFINKDPKDFNNVFNINEDFSEMKPKESIKSVNPLSNKESAILVFGYPENMCSQVIQHFHEFGNILEKFDIKQQKKFYSNLSHTSKLVPIFSGKSWVKITYDNPSSAADALQENGSVFNGALLGVIPYSKDAIEKLQKRKLTDEEDIGGGTEFVSIQNKMNKETEDLTTQNTTHASKVTIKDGHMFFMKPQEVNNSGKPEDKKDKNLGFVGNIFKYVFGFNEL